jgi:methylamine dehydrogenase accessory protein MauD
MPIGWAVVIVVQWVAIIALGAVVLGVLRQVTPHLERPPGPPAARIQDQGPAVGSRLPPFTGRDQDGEILNAVQLIGSPFVLLFLSGTCQPCVRLATEMSTAAPGDLTAMVIAVADEADLGTLRLPAWSRVLAMSTAEVAEVFSVRGRPFAVAVDADGIVSAKEGLNTVAQLTALTASTLPSPTGAVEVSLGSRP